MAQPLTLDEIGVPEADAAQVIYDLRREVRRLNNIIDSLRNVVVAARAYIQGSSDPPERQRTYTGWREAYEQHFGVKP